MATVLSIEHEMCASTFFYEEDQDGAEYLGLEIVEPGLLKHPQNSFRSL